MDAPAPKHAQAFDLIAALTFDQEGNGALSVDPGDPGNYARGVLRGTRWGFSARAYPDLDIANLDRAHATGLAFANVWLAVKCQFMPLMLAAVVFDAAFQHGNEGATRMLQRALGVPDDGNFGQVSMQRMDAVAAVNLSALCASFQAQRFLHMTQQPSWQRDAHGFARRLCTVLLFSARFAAPLRDTAT